MSQKSWSPEQSAGLYGIDFWGNNYFGINRLGHVQVQPQGQTQPALDLFKTIQAFRERGIKLPLLLRFPDIIQSQMNKLCSCFAKSIKEHAYKGSYFGAFPVKVNQQRHVIEDIVRIGQKHNFGLEAGSKPELLIALAFMNNPQGLIICNGFKDRPYVEMALLAQKAGRNVFIIIERQKEINIILEAAKRLKVKPRIGFRLQLSAVSEGFWEKSSGSGSKFGLSPLHLISAVKLLKKEGFLDCVCLAHFHIGSQIPTIQTVKSAIKEASKIVSELYLMGCPIKYVDIGGGLGVDYDGSGQTKSSVNYDIQEYANDIVFALQSACDRNKIPHPHIVSESGRFLVAQSSLLVFNVLDQNLAERPGEISEKQAQSPFLKDLYDIYKNLDSAPHNESFNDLMEKKKEMRQMFVYGNLSLKEMATAEKIYWGAISALKKRTQGREEDEDILLSLKKQLTDTYFCNFSVFQSLPDSWALSFAFPVMPLHRLGERPENRAVLADLTCDSDGKIATIINYSSWETGPSLPVHKLKEGQAYLMGIFLTGAYQEILGDLHNLFGDTDAVHVRVTGDEKYLVEHRVLADSTAEVLEYVEFHRKSVMDKIHTMTENGILKGKISRKEAGLLIEKFEENLTRSTYLNFKKL